MTDTPKSASGNPPEQSEEGTTSLFKEFRILPESQGQGIQDFT